MATSSARRPTLPLEVRQQQSLPSIYKAFPEGARSKMPWHWCVLAIRQKAHSPDPTGDAFLHCLSFVETFPIYFRYISSVLMRNINSVNLLILNYQLKLHRSKLVVINSYSIYKYIQHDLPTEQWFHVLMCSSIYLFKLMVIDYLVIIRPFKISRPLDMR